MNDRIRIFSNGIEYRAWLSRNCDLPCPRAEDCDLEYALSSAYMLDGTIAPDVAARLGFTPACKAVLGWPCRERLSLVDGKRPAAHEMRDAGAAMLPGLDLDTLAPSGPSTAGRAQP